MSLRRSTRSRFQSTTHATVIGITALVALRKTRAEVIGKYAMKP